MKPEGYNVKELEDAIGSCMAGSAYVYIEVVIGGVPHRGRLVQVVREQVVGSHEAVALVAVEEPGALR